MPVGPLSDRQLVELKTWLEPWFRSQPGGGSGWRFNVDNEGGWGYVIANDSTDLGFGDWGLVFGDTSGDGVLLVALDSPTNTANGQVWVNDNQIKLVLAPSGASATLNTDGTFSCILDGGGP